MGLVIALLAPLGAYLVAARKLSGQVKNSDAADLWKESSDIRKWSTDRVKELDDQVREVEARLIKLEVENGELARENRRVMRELVDLQEINNGLRRKILELTTRLKQAGLTTETGEDA